VHVIPNPVDIEAIRTAVDMRHPLPVRPYLIYAGRFVALKSLDTLIEAYHRLIASNLAYPADLVLTGEGEMDTTLRAQASAGAASHRIHFTGAKSWGETLRLIQGASFLLLPSHESEGCPNALLEAMALGTPVVVSDNPRLEALVTPGITGEVFPRRDAARLQACLADLSFDPERRTAYSREGERLLRERHDFGAITDT
jgi:glycosyltransferase involved in cell wall biosynthesis